MKQFMLMFSLGPVQAFIAQARKTRDLWLGSFLLSKLMEAAMEGIDDNVFVFPGKRTVVGDTADLPNKYIAIFDDLGKAKATASQSETQVETKWNAIRNEVCSLLLGQYYTGEVENIWKRQTDMHQFFEIYWVVVPENSEKDYGSWVKETILTLDARKRLRNFLPQDEPGEKSTISGEHEVLHERGTSRREVQAFWRKLTATQKLTVKDIKKDGAERLDAIDSIKRFALYSSALTSGLSHIVYPSTSSIATAPFVKKLLELESSVIDTQLEDWKQLTEENNLAWEDPHVLPHLHALADKRQWILRRDGDCFFEEAFTPRYLKENYRITNRPEDKQSEHDLRVMPENFIPDCLTALKKLYKAADARPTPYYAMIQMDGDHMGTIISNADDRTQYTEISLALSRFAREHARVIVQEKHPGRLVYAGGDDVTAFTPLDGMLPMIDELQQRYEQIVAPAVAEKDRKRATASMGIAIAHHFTPLSVVRRAALRAEKELAKDRYDRNAFVVTLLRRSGEQTSVGCHWQYDALACREEPFTPIKLFQQFYLYFLKGVFSPKAIHVLLDEAPALIGLERAAQQSEIGRVLKRQLDKYLDKEQQKLLIGEVDEQLISEQRDSFVAGKIAKKITLLADQIVALAEAMDGVFEALNKKVEQETGKKIILSAELHSDRLRYGLVEAFGWLLVMAFLAREGLEV